MANKKLLLVRYPAMARAIRAAIAKTGRNYSDLQREIFPGSSGGSAMVPLIGGFGRPTAERRLAIEQRLGLPPGVWTLDGERGVADPKPYLGAPQRKKPGRARTAAPAAVGPVPPAGPVGRALALAEAKPTGPAPLVTREVVNEVAIVFRDGRAHLRINAMVSAAQGVEAITLFNRMGLIGPAEGSAD